jgi:rod shape-determining protein MreC
VYDKTVRRRRAVLGLLVACSLILLTAYFGESAGGTLHSVQRGASTVLGPVQEGASRALKPVRDLVGWFGDTFEAKGEVQQLREELDATRAELIREEGGQREAERLAAQLEMETSLGLDEYAPVGARVISQSPTVWYRQVGINKGSGDGVRTGQAVINERGLVGTVTNVTGRRSVVTLLTDQSTSVGARANKNGVRGLVRPASAGSPNDLVLEFVQRADRLEEGDRIVTSGTESEREELESLFPPGLPLGQVSRIEEPGTEAVEIHVRPFANMRELDTVRVLTDRPRGNRR